ncbi:hypothetical protein NC652_022412 [Populus alba x Populus x berolinensis]|nr:hypothetical protein NC652_022412 [Populus alba x Populus x berolinensis]
MLRLWALDEKDPFTRTQKVGSKVVNDVATRLASALPNYSSQNFKGVKVPSVCLSTGNLPILVTGVNLGR